MTPIKRAAKAIRDLQANDELAGSDRRKVAATEKADPGTDWRNFLPAVRAVLEAVREPGLAMLGAGSHEIVDARPNSAIHAKAVWEAMIDAALESQEK